jgi:hypothetical protein
MKAQEGLWNQEAIIKSVNYKQAYNRIHNRLIKNVPIKFSKYFKERSQYKILNFSKGDVFGNGRKDYVFVTFDTNKMIPYIILYNDKTKEFRILYETIKVINGFAETECNFSFRSSDYEVGEVISQSTEYMLNYPDDYLKNERSKCVDITKDDDMVLNEGCFGDGFSKTNSKGFISLCLLTDVTMNNWICLKYDKGLDAFIVYYAQAFAD